MADARKNAAKSRKPPEKKNEPARKPARPADAPLIDTSLAAAAAARMVAHGGKAEPIGDEHHESDAFKMLKESLHKPAGQGAANFIQSSAPAKRSGVPTGGPNQMRRGQTFGADVNRSGVPRRTGG
jgi:hypothetical protein